MPVLKQQHAHAAAMLDAAADAVAKSATKFSVVLKVNLKKLTTQIGPLEKRSRNGWMKRQVTLVVSHKARS
jgi:hypothetical protein